MNSYTLPIQIKNIREENNLSQEEFGKILGISKQSICAWEKGRATPDITTIARIAEIGDCTVDELLSPKSRVSEEEDHNLYLSKREKNVILKIRALGDEQRQAVETIINSLKS